MDHPPPTKTIEEPVAGNKLKSEQKEKAQDSILTNAKETFIKVEVLEE